MTITLRVSDEELNTIKGYAKSNGVSVAKVVRNAILERIEDEHDLKIAEKAHTERLKGNQKTYTLEEVRKELGLYVYSK